MFTRFTPQEVIALNDPKTVSALADGTSDVPSQQRDMALYMAICSLERIAGADSPEVDAFRNLGRIGRTLAAR